MFMLSVGILLVVGAYLALRTWVRFDHRRNEPPIIESGIPFITHGLGLLKGKSNYIHHLYQQYRYSVYTLRLPFVGRLYVLNDPALVHMAERQVNSVAFGPVARDFGFIFSGLTKESQATIMSSGMFKENGDYETKQGGYVAIIHTYMQDRASRDSITRDAVQSLSHGIETLANPSVQYGLLETLQHIMILSMTDALYGPQNPFRNPFVEKSWQAFVPGVVKIVLGIFPSLLARKSVKGRAHVIQAFEQYFANGGHLEAPQSMVRSMQQLALTWQLPSQEIAKMEIATCLALLSSGPITLFWVLFHIYSNPNSLQECRDEIIQLLEKKEAPNGQQCSILDLSQLAAKCPTLFANLQETFRFHSTVISAKSVMVDTYLDNRYLLRKGSMMLVPGSVIHKSADIWGPDAHQFNHHHFLNKRKVGTTGFRPFGAGQTMCPGRHFSTNVILSFAAMMILQYDLIPKDGRWIMPSKSDADIWNTMPKPLEHQVTIIRRSMEPKDVPIKFVWGGSEDLQNTGNHVSLGSTANSRDTSPSGAAMKGGTHRS